MRKTIFGLLFSLCCIVLNAQQATNSPSIFDLMSGVEIRTVHLVFPLDTLVNNRRLEDKLPGTLTFKDNQNQKQEWGVKVSLRGKYRRLKCTDMPPFKLDFKKKDLEAAGLARHDDYKLVNFCMGEKDIAEDILIREYLTYQLYREITPASFRVQLLNIVYTDSQTGKSFKQKAFIIEDTAELRDRIGATKNKSNFGITEASLHPQEQQTAALFQYMIGNHDWQFNSGKNVKLVKKEDALIPVPYDFDFSFLVNAPYLKIDNINNLDKNNRIAYRVYQGFEKDPSLLKQTTKLFLSKEKALKNIIKHSSLLSNHSKREMLAYLDYFFDHPTEMVFKAEEEIIESSVSEK